MLDWESRWQVCPIALTSGHEVFYNLSMSIDNMIHIEFPDDEIPVRSQEDLKIDALVSEVRKKAREIAGGAKDLSEYVKAFYLDYKYGIYDALAWIFKQGDEVNLNDLVEDISNGDGKKEVGKKVSAIEEMKKVLDGAPEKEGFVKMTVKKIRRGDDVLGLRVLAEFPEEVFIPHTGFDDSAAGFMSGKQTVYYEPNAACFRNAFDDANKESLKNADSEYKVYYLQVMDTEEARRSIRPGIDGIAEYVLGKDEAGNKIKQRMDSFLWIALVHRGHQEDLHFKVSDFWKRNAEDKPLK